MIKTYSQAVEYLKSYIPFTLYQTEAYQQRELKDPLDRMRYLLKLLDNPEKKFKSVLIGGTSGKGSTSYLISHILTTAGYKIGLTLSPHLVRINERIQINDTEIPDGDFIELINLVVPAVDTMKNSEYGVPSYFEIIIGIAFVYFAKQNVDIAVVEVGMGGEYDATNTLEPLIAILTNVSLDHTQFLGDTVEEIAKTKAGIIKKPPVILEGAKRPIESHIEEDPIVSLQDGKLVVVTGVKQPSVIKIVEDRCKATGAKLFRLGKDFNNGTIEQLNNFILGLPGDYQKENASLALETIKQLNHFGFSVSSEQIKDAFQTAHFSGRFEIIKSPCDTCGTFGTFATFVLDGAHNSAKMRAFVTSLQKAYPKPKKIFVIAFKKDKNIEDMLKEILPVAEAIVITEFSIGTDTMISNAAMPAEEIVKMIEQLSNRTIEQSKNVFIEKDSTKAVKKATELVEENTIIAITGSLYLIGELKQNKTFH